jgi:hypothetical protein
MSGLIQGVTMEKLESVDIEGKLSVGDGVYIAGASRLQPLATPTN